MPAGSKGVRSLYYYNPEGKVTSVQEIKITLGNSIP